MKSEGSETTFIACIFYKVWYKKSKEAIKMFFLEVIKQGIANLPWKWIGIVGGIWFVLACFVWLFVYAATKNDSDD